MNPHIALENDSTIAKASDAQGDRSPRPSHIVACSSRADDRPWVLTRGETLAVLDHYGDITPKGLGEEGLYHEGTRYLSCLLLELEGGRPFLLRSALRDEGHELEIALTNPDVVRDGQVHVPLCTLHLGLTKFLRDGIFYQQFQIVNHGLHRIHTALTFRFAADYADIFEVCGQRRPARGKVLAPKVTDACVVLGYRGLDGVVRRTVLRFDPPPSQLHASAARLDVRLEPGKGTTSTLTIACEGTSRSGHPPAFDAARADAERERERSRAWACHLRTGNGQFNAWLDRSASDLHMLTADLATGPYPYAGVPWFNTPFGRDGLITALECLWLRPGLARGVLAYLAAQQATKVAPEQDAEPGKILHETRRGEMAALHEVPFAHYYGSVDATPLFVMLAGAYYLRTGDREFVEQLWPHIEAALDWIDRYGDRDGDGFVEYQRQSPRGLLHQGWRDSDDAVFHTDGSSAEGPIALCDVQGYVYAAWEEAAKLATALGRPAVTSALKHRAEALRQRFEEAFWCEELSTYALALDGDKRPCRVRTSHAGRALFTGIARPDRARRVAEALFAPDGFSGWGIRTIAASEARYNPMSYHNGAVWPHDNALIALGLSRYGLGTMASRLLKESFGASLYFDLYRLPELFCGFAKQAGEGPVSYPLACAPQAWSAASAFLLLQASLGLTVNGLARRVAFVHPSLPAWLGEVRIHNLEVAGAALDLLVVCREEDVNVKVLRSEGGVEVRVVK